MQCMVKNLVEIGSLQVAISIIIEMRNQGVEPCTQMLNCVVDVTHHVFVEMCKRGAFPDSSTITLYHKNQ